MEALIIRGALRAVNRAGKFATAQGIAQVLGLIAGVMIVRILSVEEYAIYALMGAFIGITGTTCDLGTGGALVAFTGKARSAAERAAAIAAVDHLRRWFTMASIVGATVLLLCHPIPREVGIPAVVALLGLVVAIIAVQGRVVFHRMLAAVNGDHRRLNAASIGSAAFRLALVATAFVVVSWLALWLALLAWLLATGLMLLLLRAGHAVPPGPVDPATRAAVLRYARPLWPGHAYFVVQSVLPLFALGIAAGAVAVAELGALSRLAQVTMFVTPVTAYILMPWISRGAFTPRAALGIAWLVAVGVALTVAGWLFADPLLWVLGDGYSHLGDFVPIALGLAALTMLSGGAYQILLAGGHTVYLWFGTLAGLAAQAVMLAFFPITDLPSAYWFLAVTQGAPLIVHLGLVGRAVLVSQAKPVLA